MSQNWAEVLLFICVVAQFFCVTASVTSASRMMFAFSRDGAVPGHQLWRRSRETACPRNAVWAIVVLAGLLMVPAIWNYLVGYGVGTAIAVIGLYIAFILPVYLRLRLGDSFERGVWSLGRHYKWIDVVSIVWVGADHDPVLVPALQGRASLGGRLLVGADELHRPLVRGNRNLLRRLVGDLGQELVQGAGAHGHRGGARADGGGAARAVRDADRGRARLGAGRRWLRGAHRAPLAPSRAERLSERRAPSAVRSIRAKCSAA